MTEIRLWNNMTKTKEVLRPADPAKVGMYVCGPTVYDRAHLGNARPVVVFDVLFRLLRHYYGENSVTYVRNFTDVDDRINQTAQDRKAAGDPRSLEALIRERSDETIRWYREDMGALGALPPTKEPRATEFIPQMIAMIGELIAKGAAYEAEGHVLFSVEAYKKYGQLSRRTVDDMIAGARVEVAPYKRNPMDFVLWKPSTDDLPGWDSPWGRGRPGWHIECSAMARELLGESFDIHGGGIDLQFPHHENEIAQTKCLHGEESFAKIWMHNEMLQVEGEKMSKSLGNFFTVRDLLRRGIPGGAIRLMFLESHYSTKMNWTQEKLETALSSFGEFDEVLSRGVVNYHDHKGSNFVDEVVSALCDDLDTHSALKLIKALAKSSKESDEKRMDLLSSLEFLGLRDPITEHVEAAKGAISKLSTSMEKIRVSGVDPLDALVASLGTNDIRVWKLLNLLSLFSESKSAYYSASSNWLTEGRKRAHRTVNLSDIDRLETLVGTSDTNKLIEERDRLKNDRQFDKADAIRSKLERFGVQLIDTPTGTQWKLIH